MSPEGYAAHLHAAHEHAAHIAALPLTEMIRAIDLANVTGPILDPTAFIRNGKAMNEDKAVLSILLCAQRALVELAAEVTR